MYYLSYAGAGGDIQLPGFILLEMQQKKQYLLIISTFLIPPRRYGADAKQMIGNPKKNNLRSSPQTKFTQPKENRSVHCLGANLV